jgi:hypothetical protein
LLCARRALFGGGGGAEAVGGAKKFTPGVSSTVIVEVYAS